jgi:hypothetical protein
MKSTLTKPLTALGHMLLSQIGSNYLETSSFPMVLRGLRVSEQSLLK